MITFTEFLKETSLGQISKSHKILSWDAYVVPDPKWKSNDYTVERDANIIDVNKKILGRVKKGDQIKILSLELIGIPKTQSQFASISADGIEGFLPITAIRKPTFKIHKSAELTPAKLGLEGIKFSLESLVAEIPIALNRIEISDELRDHVLDCVGSIVNKNLFEETLVFEKTIKLSRQHESSVNEIILISKNFGEVLGAIFLLKTNKKAKFVEFPLGTNQRLYDFIEYSDDNRKVYYSIKSGKGSAASLKNIEFFLKYLGQEYSSEEVNKIKTLVAGTKEHGTTVDIILNYINTFESDVVNLVTNTLDLKELSFSELTSWQERASKLPFEEVIATLKKIYDKIGYPINATTKTTIEGILSRTGKQDRSKNGIIVFPLGTYMIRKLNLDEKIIGALNTVFNLSYISSRVLQSNVDITNTEMSFKLAKFVDKSFMFKYKAQMSDPTINAIGFIET